MEREEGKIWERGVVEYGSAVLAGVRTCECQRRSGKDPLLIWPSGKRGRKKGDDGEEKSAWRGRREVERRGGREGGGQRYVHYCSSAEGGVSQ